MTEPSWDDLRHSGADTVQRYEHAALRNLCKLLNHLEAARSVEAESRQRTAHGLGTFALFEELTGFPVALRVRRLLNVRWLSVPDLFNKFDRTPITKGFLELGDEIDLVEQAAGLVFRWPGDKDELGKRHAVKGGKFMVAHNYTAREAVSGTCVTGGVCIGRVSMTLHIETMTQFATRFDNWDPL